MIKHMHCLLFIGWTGCLAPEALYEVELSGTVISDQSGPVELWFMHASRGEGVLETEHIIFDTTWLDSEGDFTYTLQVPQAGGEGLEIYGWQDTNEDGAHCRPGTDPELSGLVESTDYPAHAIEIELELFAECEGPESL